jgi:capsular polysaccharide transport system permease protein
VYGQPIYEPLDVCAGMVVERKYKTRDRPIVYHVSTAFPTIQRAFRTLRFGIVVQGPNAQSQRVKPLGADSFTRLLTATNRPPWLVVSFTLVVILPIIIASLYFAAFASDQFVSELRFAIRGTTERLPGADALGAGGGLAYLNSSQEVYAIAEYIRSRAAIEEVGRTIDVRRLFRASRADWLSRLKDQATGEELLWYWHRMVTVSTEAVSGLISVEVRAFTGDDAVAIASAIRGASEALVNRMQQRPRDDMVTQAESEVRAAREQAALARDEVAQYRNSRAVVDPLDSARSLIDTVSELKTNLIALDVELESAKAATGANAPGVQTLRARRDSLREQIQGLERRLTNGGDQTAARQMFDYDKVEIKRVLAEQHVALAEKILDQVRTEAHRRQIYVDVIEGPTTPQSARFPERTYSVTKIAIGALGLWGMIVLTVAGVRDHAN